ncbi:DNA mismatch repair protein MutS [Roseospira marina]|uniref:DNA mismatch repair protein MutS n=1 Tax=Roseospira marina TaxID=140057 RepID=A0A5M6I839_9PROT|nr:DNA mismatch repair protein MutS [Roseospira marina]
MPSDSNRRRRSGPPALSESDLRLWQEVTRSAMPLPGRRRAGKAGARVPEGAETAPGRGSEGPVPPASGAVSAPRPPAAPPKPRAHRADVRLGESAGIDKRTHDRFRRGRMAIDGRLDLHGMTRERAHQALALFLHRAYERGARCVLVVTGKGTGREGGGVLRRDVPLWLNQAGLRGLVLSFTHAQIRDGGEGALYVLVRRRREGREGSASGSGPGRGSGRARGR